MVSSAVEQLRVAALGSSRWRRHLLETSAESASEKRLPGREHQAVISAVKVGRSRRERACSGGELGEPGRAASRAGSAKESPKKTEQIRPQGGRFLGESTAFHVQTPGPHTLVSILQEAPSRLSAVHSGLSPRSYFL